MSGSTIYRILIILSLLEWNSIEGNEDKKVTCHAHRAYEMDQSWSYFFDSSGQNCTNDNCMLLWGLTKERKVRVLAQGCAKGAAQPRPIGGRVRLECPGGSEIQPRALFKEGEGFDFLSSLTHVQLCVCYEDWCNKLEDGENCEGKEDGYAYCNPMDALNEPAAASNFTPAVDLRKEREKEIKEEEKKEEEEKERTARVTQSVQRAEENELYKPTPATADVQYTVVAVAFVVIVAAMCILSFALSRKYCTLCGDSHEQRYRHTSSRLNSIAQVTILTEVAQGYKQEAEDLIRESQDGGPHQIANWRYDESVKLGTGSFGAVYRVEMRPDYLVDAKIAALKTFSHMRSTHFFNESRTLKYVHDFKNHPNIIQYLGRAVDCRDTLEEATWRIAFELCEGGTMREWITASPISLLQYLEAASGLLSALAFIHTEESIQTSLLSFRGSSTDSANFDARSNSRARRSSKAAIPVKKKLRIAHCDINTRNILVRNATTGNVVLADFGLALTDREKRQEEVAIREIGTIRYLAPEMLQSLINLNDTLNSLILVDTYATGLVLWELLSRTVEMYESESLVPAYIAPFERELKEIEGTMANRLEAMRTVVVRRGVRPSWGGRVDEWREREEEAIGRDEESGMSEEEKFLLLSSAGISSMMARDPDARMTIAAMGEKVDTMRLKVLRTRERVSRDDSLLDEMSGSNS